MKITKLPLCTSLQTAYQTNMTKKSADTKTLIML